MTVAEYSDLAKRRLQDYVDTLAISAVYVDIKADKFYVVLDSDNIFDKSAQVWRALEHTVDILPLSQIYRMPKDLYVCYHQRRWI